MQPPVSAGRLAVGQGIARAARFWVEFGTFISADETVVRSLIHPKKD
jgi:hypothetical protein